MSGDLLRLAADELRKHAFTAQGGKWVSLDGGDRLIAVTPDNDFAYLVTEEPAKHGGTADYIALMHPPVALALADWLEANAGWMTDNYPSPGGRTQLDGVDDAAMAVARAILREAPDA